MFLGKTPFYCGNKSLLVFKWNASLHTYKVDEIAKALLTISDDSRICHCTLTSIEHNCSFLIDRSKLSSLADLKADDSGSWKNNGICSVVIIVVNGSVSIMSQTTCYVASFYLLNASDKLRFLGNN